MNELLDRIEQLECAIAEIQQKIEVLQAELTAQKVTELTIQQGISPSIEAGIVREAGSAEAPSVLIEPQKKPSKKSLTDFAESIQKSEFWLNKIGITLLLVSIVLLFKYSIDQGWLTPWVRVGFGFAVGVCLIGLGIRIYTRKFTYAQVLFGGGVAALCITMFAAFQLYSLIPYSIAIIFMVCVSALAFSLSIWQNDSVLAIIGTVGGLATPFLLYSKNNTVQGLVIYTCLILAGVSAIYWKKGWRTVLWASFVGVWGAFLTAFIPVLFT